MSTESIKINLKVLEKVRKNKKKTGVGIQAFIEQATLEKLKREGAKKA